MEKIGKYKISGILGKGAMGIVYKALDPDINREVAVKTVRFDLVSEDESENEEIMERFMREAQSAGKLTHPNIITIFDVGREESLTYIVMQFIQGQSLQRLIASGEKLPTTEVVQLYEQICSALDYAHSFGIVHRDVKPGNILLNKEGKPFIVDFGVARVDTSTLTQSGTAVGTPSYMSPEQVMGKKVDNRSDIFSLGCILFELLTGRRPFEAESITTVIYKIINEEPPHLSEVKKGLPVGFGHIINKALAKDPKDRYQSCKELAADLHDLDQLSEKTIAITMAKEKPVAVKKVKKRRLGLKLGISIPAILVIIVGGAYFLHQKTGNVPVLSSLLNKLKPAESLLIPESGAITPETKEIEGKVTPEGKKAGEPSLTTKTKTGVPQTKQGKQKPVEQKETQKSTTPPKSQPKTPIKKEVKPKATVGEKKPTNTLVSPGNKAIMPGSVEFKVNKLRENYAKGDYRETVRLAEEVLSEEPDNVFARDYRDRAKNKLSEESLKQALTAGISSYNRGDYEQCKQKMNEILRLDSNHKEALRYRSLADQKIYEITAKVEIIKVVERQKKAEEEEEFVLLLSDIGSPSLKGEKQNNARDLFNFYDNIKWSSITYNPIIFQGRNRAEVRFSYMSTAVGKKSGKRVQIFEGEIIWIMEKQGNAWKIISEEKK